MNDMYNTYDNIAFDYDYPISFEDRNKDYLKMNTVPNVTWNYGDTIRLTFNLVKDGESETYFDDKGIMVYFYNFRGEEVYSVGFGPYTNTSYKTISVDIDVDTSNDIFIRGIYSCSIKVFNEDKTDIETIMTDDSYLIHVI